MVIKIRTIYLLIWMFLFIICSGSSFGIENARYMDTLLILFSLIIWVQLKERALKRNFNIAALMACIIILNYLLYIWDAPNLAGYISYIFRLFSAMLVCDSMTFEEYKKWFSEFIIAIAVIGLLVYAQNLVVGVRGETTTLYFFRTIMINGTLRNAGIFWEPGAYQMFLNLSLLFVLERNDFRLGFINKNNRRTLIACVILIISVVTTYSTIGYINILLFMITWYIKNNKNLNRTVRALFIILGAIIIAYISYNFIQSDIIMGKFFGGGNTGSTETRISDLLASFEIIRRYPFGMGHGTITWYSVLLSYDVINNSSGLFSAICSMGIIFGVCFVYRIVKFARQQYINLWFPFLAIVLISGLTENFYFYPVYFVFLYQFRSNDKNLDMVKLPEPIRNRPV